MTTSTTVRDLIDAGQPAIGTFLSLGSPITAEICASAGLDWVLVDLEHGVGDETTLLAQLQACSGTATAVRPETGARIRIGRALDLGAQAIMVPRIDTVDEARDALRHLAYPPRGDRGVFGSARSRRFGATPASFADADREVVGIVQIESKAAVDVVDEIAALPGTDVLFVGPSDLTHSLGVPGDLDAPAFTEAVTAVITAAERHGTALGIHVTTPGLVERYADLGFTLIARGSDTSMVAGAVAEIARSLPQRSAGAVTA